METAIDGLPVRLREPHDLGFLARWGRVFRVFDDQDSGNLCFGVESASCGRVFVKYAGAEPLRYQGSPSEARDRLRHAAEVYRALAHPTLVQLVETLETDAGSALVFEWSDSVSLGRQYGAREALAGLSVGTRARAVQEIYDFHAHAASRGWVAVDLYDGSVLIDPSTGRVTICDVDFYQPAPFINTTGRMWGSERFMSPEEHEKGALIDEVTNLVALGSLAHTLLGDDDTKSRDAWRGTDDQFAIAERARRPLRQDRCDSVSTLAKEWAATVH